MYRLVAPRNVLDIWDRAAPWIAQALGQADDIGNPEYWPDLSVLKERACAGMLQLWIGHPPGTNEIDLVLLTEGVIEMGRRILIVRWGCGQHMEDWIQDLGILENWANNAGFDEIRIHGRRGWERKLRPLGYIHKATIIGRKLDRGIH